MRTQVYHPEGKWCLRRWGPLKAKNPLSCPGQAYSKALWIISTYRLLRRFQRSALLRSSEFLVSQRPDFQKLLRLNGSAPYPRQHAFSAQIKKKLVFENFPWLTEVVEKIKRLVLKQVSVKVGSSLPVRCMASWAKSADSKYPMLTWARDLLDYKMKMWNITSEVSVSMECHHHVFSTKIQTFQNSFVANNPVCLLEILALQLCTEHG